jgi:hypothetical protein
MKLLRTLLVVIVYFEVVFGIVKPIEQNLKVDQSFHKTIIKFFDMEHSNTRIITNDENDSDANELKLIPLSNVSSTFELIESSKLENLTLQPSSSNIFFAHSMIDFQTILRHLNSKKFKLDGHFLLIAQNCSNIDAKNIFTAAWKRFVVNINILCRDNNTTSIKTFVPFQKYSCGNTSSLTLSESDEFFPKKLNNLFGCPMRVATFFYPPITMRETLSNGTFRYCS